MGFFMSITISYRSVISVFLSSTVRSTKQSIEILERLKPITGHRTHLFPSYIGHKKHCNVETANKAFIRMGYKTN